MEGSLLKDAPDFPAVDLPQQVHRATPPSFWESTKAFMGCRHFIGPHRTLRSGESAGQQPTGSHTRSATQPTMSLAPTRSRGFVRSCINLLMRTAAQQRLKH